MTEMNSENSNYSNICIAIRMIDHIVWVVDDCTLKFQLAGVYSAHFL